MIKDRGIQAAIFLTHRIIVDTVREQVDRYNAWKTRQGNGSWTHITCGEFISNVVAAHMGFLSVVFVRLSHPAGMSIPESEGLFDIDSPLTKALLGEPDKVTIKDALESFVTEVYGEEVTKHLPWYCADEGFEWRLEEWKLDDDD